MSQGRNRVLLPGHYLVHGHCGQHLQPDCRTRRLYPLDCFTEQLVGLSVTQSITEKRRLRLVTNPNNTLAQYITNLPRRISLSGVWECGLTEIPYPHDCYNVRNARLTVEHDGDVETDVCFEDGYYHSPKALATTLNCDKPGRVTFSYEPVTQKFTAHVKSKTKFTLYGDLPDILGFGAGSGDSSGSLASSASSMFVRAYSIVDLRRGFESLYVYSSIVEPRIVGDKIAPFLRIVPMNYDDYYARQVGEALPYFTGARVQRGHGFGSLFSGLPRTVAPLIRLERELLAMSWLVRTSRRQQNERQRLPAEI